MQKPDLLRAIDIAKACLMLLTLVGCGAGLGYWAGIERSRDMLIAERVDKLQEIERLNSAHAVALSAVSGRQFMAASRISEAADTAAAAAETAQGAAAIAGKAAKAAGVPAAVIERDRKAINSTIQRANERIAGEGANDPTCPMRSADCRLRRAAGGSATRMPAATRTPRPCVEPRAPRPHANHCAHVRRMRGRCP